MTFVEKVLDFIQGGEEGKISKFQKENLKGLERQIRIRKEEIEQNETSIGEKQDELYEASLSIDVDRIKTVQDRALYIEKYNEKLWVVLDEIESLRTLNDNLSEEINRFETIVKLLK